MSNIAMNNPNIQRRVLNSMHDQPMSMLFNQCSVPLPPNYNQERNPESKINLAFGLLRKNTARTNGIWKIIQSLIDRIKKVEELTAMIDQVIKRNEELEDKRRKNNKKRNEKKRIKREQRQEAKKRLKEDEEQKNKEEEVGENKVEKSIIKENKNLDLKIRKEEQERKMKKEKNLSSRNPNVEISRKKFDSRNDKNDSMNNLEISRTNLINKKIINKKINNKKKIINKDEIDLNDRSVDNKEDECSLQLKDKINQGNEKLSRNGRNRQNVINLVNRFIFNNYRIETSNRTWIMHTFIPLVEDIIDLDLYELDVSDYIRKIQSPPEFRKEFWQWWQNKEVRNQMIEIQKITQRLKQSKDPDILRLLSSTQI